MTIREKLADWISGGALTMARYEREKIRDELARCSDELTSAWHVLANRDEVSERLRNDMRQIASLETPSANATVRKMARIAREALGE